MKVSILIITYNHENYIAQAIESILMQKVNFDYEIVIGEDCSTDGTRDIIINYQKRYPAKIRLLLSEKNVGAKRNFVRTYEACQGEYIAWLDGDDYWTSANKLQTQVDYLDNHPECTICFHNAETIIKDKTQASRLLAPRIKKETYTLEDLLSYNFIPTCTVMFRNGIFIGFPEWCHSVLIGDWILYLLVAQYGNIGYLDRVMSAYRIHHNGSWSGSKEIIQFQDIIKLYKLLNSHFEYKYNRIIHQGISISYLNMATLYLEEGDLRSSEKYILKSIVNYPLNLLKYWPDMGTLFVKLYLPVFYKLMKYVLKSKEDKSELRLEH